MRSVPALVAFTLVLLAGCTGLAAPPEPTLAGTAWKLTGWSEPGINPENFTFTASFADGRMAGKAAVNNYFAAYTEGPDGKFTVSQAGSTMMAGPPAAMQAEQTYLRLLERARSYRRADAALTLADSAGQTLLVFALSPPSAGKP